MPNWCENEVVISGSKEDIEKVRELMETEESKFDFNSVLPSPDEFKGIHSGSCKIDGVQCNIWREVDGKNVAISEEEQAEMIKKYGSTNWYDWNCENWGTKWNAGDVYVKDNGPDSLDYVFDTAWAPPIPVIEKLAEIFPTVEITLQFEEGGAGFYGEMHWENGEMTYNEEGELEWNEEEEEYVRV
jgi:hypothetical protein